MRLPSFAKLLTGFLRLFRLGGRAMPLDLVLHEGDPFSLHRLSQNEDRPGSTALVKPSRFSKSNEDLIHIVAVDLENMPSEGPPLVGDRLERHDLRHRAVDLSFVIVL